MTPPPGIFVASREVEVRYAETDAMGVVHHASYLLYLELGRTGYMSRRGHDYASIERSGYAFAVVGMTLRYHRPARYGDVLRVDSWLTSMSSRAVAFGYELRNAAAGEMLFSGDSRHVCLGRDGRVARIPEPVAAWRDT